MVVAICAQLNIIWDDADELHRLARLSHPRITVDTAGLSPAATELASAHHRRHRRPLARRDRARQSPGRAHPQAAARARRAPARPAQERAHGEAAAPAPARRGDGALNAYSRRLFGVSDNWN